MATAGLAMGDQGVCDITFEAAAVMAEKYIAVMLDSTINRVAICTAGTGKPIGILQDVAAAVGDPVRVRIAGTTLVRAGGAFSIGDDLNSDSTTDGHLDTVSASEYVIATALQAATAEDDEVKALIVHYTAPA